MPVYLYLIPVFIYLILDIVPAMIFYSRVTHEGSGGFIYAFICSFSYVLMALGLLPPAPFLGTGTLLTGYSWLVTAGL